MNWTDVFEELGEGCWNWPRTKTPLGYGQKSVFGKNMYTHRLSFILSRGREPRGIVRHKCDNPSCYRPNHLVEGSKLQNSRDMVSRDRHTRGEKNAQSKLTAAQVVEIRKAYDLGQETAVSIGLRFGVHGATVSKIGKRQRWTDARNF